MLIFESYKDRSFLVCRIIPRKQGLRQYERAIHSTPIIMKKSYSIITRIWGFFKKNIDM